MTKTTQVQKFENGNIIDADEVNQVVENAGSLNGIRPYNSDGTVNTSGDKDCGESIYPLGNGHFRSDKELIVYDPLTKAVVGNITWLQLTQGGSGGGAGVEIAELKSHLEKKGIFYPVSNKDLLNESFTDSTNLVIAPRVSYVSGTTLIADINKTDIDLMNATTGWTAGTNTPTVAQDTTNKIEGTGSVKMTKASLNGSIDMYKAFTAFSLSERKLCFSFFPDTITNVTRFYVKIESSASNDKTYYVPVANITASAWNHICIDPDNDTADASTGTLVNTGITKIYFGYTTSSSQTVNVSVDFVVYTPNWILPLPYSLYIWDGTNQERLVISAVAGTGNTQRNTYTITALTNGYAVGASYAKERNLTIANSQGVFVSGLSGAVALSSYDQTSLWLPENVSGKTLTMSQRWQDEVFKISTIVSTSSFKLSSVTDKKAYFKDNDYVIVFDKRMMGRKFNSRYNSTVGKNWYLLQLNADATHASSEITLSHDGTNAGIDTSYWYCVRYSAEMLYLIEDAASAGALNTLTPTIFIPFNQGTPYHAYLHSYWKLNSPTSTNEVNSLQPTGLFNLTQNGTVPSTTGKLGLARGVFSTSNYFTYEGGGSSSTIYDTKAFIFEVWFKTSVTGATQYIWDKSNLVNAGYAFFMDTSNRLNFTYNSAAGYVQSPSGYADGNWHYFVFAMLAASGAAMARMYIDGGVVDTDTGASFTASSNDPHIGVSTAHSNPFQGLLCEMGYSSTVPATVAELETLIALRYFNGVGKYYGDDIGFIVRGSVQNQSGNKLTTGTKLTRQDTTNQLPSVFQRDVLLS